jgi:signal peptidase II
MDFISRKNLFLFWSSGGLILAGDQLSKMLIRLRGGFYICNPSIALGLKIPEALFWIFWLGIIILISYLIYRECIIQNTLYLILIFAGALSNLIDRLWHGCIVDFIQLGFGPIFNLADFFITLGAIMLMITYLKVKR